ncbi:unnamed protein product [Cylindrotheca closterium]|uniref:Uncharacterized protein n=1 Tax=Cylindrotheca closterium TaxID=2856 RepID=A0AAD2GAF1_9STRA|nr:unnamed protein product [Cylindrotheca closterium]
MPPLSLVSLLHAPQNPQSLSLTSTTTSSSTSTTTSSSPSTKRRLHRSFSEGSSESSSAEFMKEGQRPLPFLLNNNSSNNNSNSNNNNNKGLPSFAELISTTAAGSNVQEQPEPQEEEEVKHVSFNPKVLVIQPVFLEDSKSNNSKNTTKPTTNSKTSKQSRLLFAKSDCWYTEPDIDEFQKASFLTIKRFQRNWHLTNDDCLRGLESQTTKCTATKVRIKVYNDLVLNKQDTVSKRMIAKSPMKQRQMIGVILKASAQDAYELAQMDAMDAQLYQQEKCCDTITTTTTNDDEQNKEQDGFKCFLFWDLPKWLSPKNNHKFIDTNTAEDKNDVPAAPAIVDLPI